MDIKSWFGMIAVVFIALLKEDGFIESEVVRLWMIIGGALAWTIAFRPYVSGTYYKIFADRSVVENRSCIEVMTYIDRNGSWAELIVSYFIQVSLWALIAIILFMDI